MSTTAGSSSVLQALLQSLQAARLKDPDHALVLDSASLTGAGAVLLALFERQLEISSFKLTANIQLPDAVTGDVLVVSGDGSGLTLTVTFADQDGEVGLQALFQAPKLDAITTLFTALPKDFYAAIDSSADKPAVAVPGVQPKLSFGGAVYGLLGIASPSGGLVTYTIVPDVRGLVTATGGERGLDLELGTQTSAWRIVPAGEAAWSFDDVGWLIPGLDFLAKFPAIIGTTGLELQSFELNLFPTAPDLSTLTVVVAAAGDPTEPLWSAAGGKIAMVDVAVSLSLTFDESLTLSLTGTGWVRGDFVLGSIRLQAQIPFPPTGVWSLTAYPNLALPDLRDIAALVDGGSLKLDELMPADLAHIGGFTFTYLRVAVDVSDFSLVEFTFALRSSNAWTLIPDHLVLEDLRIQMTIVGKGAITGGVLGSFLIGSASRVYVAFGRANAALPWRLSVTSPAISLPSIGDISKLANGANLAPAIQAAGLDKLHFLITDLNLGVDISPTKLTNLGMTLLLAGADDPLDPTLDWAVIPGALTLTNFQVGFQLTWKPELEVEAFGLFTLNGLNFEVRFGSGADADAFVAAYSPATADAGTIDLHTLVSGISPDLAAVVPAGLTLDLEDALVAYLNTGGTKKYLFAMDIAVTFPLSDIPLVGSAFSDKANVAIKNLKVIVASAPLTPADVTAINALLAGLHGSVSPLPSGGGEKAGDAIPKGFSMAAELELGDLTILLTSPPGDTTTTGPDALPAVVDAVGAAAASPVMWVNVEKTFGPVSIEKVGFMYRDGAVFVLTNMTLAAGGLEIALLGLGIGSTISKPSVRFTIQGVGVSFKEGPVAIQGGLLGTIDPVDFVGALSVEIPDLALRAFGGYAEYDHHPSFFLYGVLLAPLGGPPAFFVTGVAAGFGFNRKLILPDITQVDAFPFVQWAVGSGDPPKMDPSKPIGSQVEQVLTRLAGQGIVPPSVGDYWLAAGIRFTSFELLDSFALLTGSFGTHFEIALLGLSTLQMPPKAPGTTVQPVAEVQMALDASFSPDTGLLAVAAQLTKNSYILSRDARLTGGFAFYLWFSGEHAGETVVTLGGYNPHFTVPEYYPKVPRVGLDWQVVPGTLTIKGGLYFALTSNAVMAGGSLSAVWTKGPIRAWFDVWADFLMVFSPFHYFIDAGIDLGASFSVKLLFVRVSMTIHVGVAVQIWGPEFAGKATVDLSIVSFTIEFGSHAPDRSTTIPWSRFVSELLPSQPSAATHAAALAAGANDAHPAVVQITIGQGLVRALDAPADDPLYLVNGETFRCSVLTVIPSKDTTLTGNVLMALDSEQPKDEHGNVIPSNNGFGVGPAGVAPADFIPRLTIDVAAHEDSSFVAVRRLANAPKALWERKDFDGHGVPKLDPATALTDATVDNTLQGYELVPQVAAPDHTLPILLEWLVFTLDDKIQHFSWSAPVVATTDRFTNQTVASTITDPAVAGVRSELLAALTLQDVALDTDLDVGSLADPANGDLMAAPVRRLLGEQKAGAAT